MVLACREFQRLTMEAVIDAKNSPHDEQITYLQMLNSDALMMESENVTVKATMTDETEIIVFAMSSPLFQIAE